MNCVYKMGYYLCCPENVYHRIFKIQGQSANHVITTPMSLFKEHFAEKKLHHTSYVNIPSGDCGDSRASTLFTNLQGIITWPTNLPLGFSFGPRRNSSVLSRRMFSSLSVPTKVPRKIRPSVTVTRSVSFKRL